MTQHVPMHHHPLETHYGSDVDEPQLIDRYETLVN